MNILFDLDGTLTDPFEGITNCMEYALVALGRPAPARESLHWCIGPPLRESLGRLLASDDSELTERAVRLYRDRFSTVGLFENDVYAGIPDALAALEKAGHPMILATSKPALYADRILLHFGLRRHFRAVYGSELGGALSDKAALLALVLEKESLRPSETMMVGDREYDMRGASANGIAAIGVLWGYGTREELEAAGATSCIAVPSDLVAAIDRICTGA